MSTCLFGAAFASEESKSRKTSEEARQFVQDTTMIAMLAGP